MISIYKIVHAQNIINKIIISHLNEIIIDLVWYWLDYNGGICKFSRVFISVNLGIFIRKWLRHQWFVIFLFIILLIIVSWVKMAPIFVVVRFMLSSPWS